MPSDRETKLLLCGIEDKLQEIVDILRVSQKDAIENTRRRVLEPSAVRKKIYDLCDGKTPVGGIAEILGKSVQQISNNVVVLQNAGLIKEHRRGREKCYIRSM